MRDFIDFILLVAFVVSVVFAMMMQAENDSLRARNTTLMEKAGVVSIGRAE